MLKLEFLETELIKRQACGDDSPQTFSFHLYSVKDQIRIIQVSVKDFSK